MSLDETSTSAPILTELSESRSGGLRGAEGALLSATRIGLAIRWFAKDFVLVDSRAIRAGILEQGYRASS